MKYSAKQEAFFAKHAGKQEQHSATGQVLELADVTYDDKASPRTALPICTHRGKLLDQTTCRCKVFACSIHGTCSDSKRAGLTVCPCDSYQVPPPALTLTPARTKEVTSIEP